MAEGLKTFDGIWTEMTPREQGRIVGLLVEQVTYDGKRERVTITFAPAGIKTLAEKVHQLRPEQCAGT